MLSEALLAPLASRGDRVAWAEQTGGRQRVLVYDLRSDKSWTAASLSACVGTLCYRIDDVELADGGVVFDRGAIGAQPSFVVRRAFSGSPAESMQIERDPQPDLAPSARGALYYALGRGWYRWDFGEREPRRIAALDTPSATPISYDGRSWLLLQHQGCKDSIVEKRSDGRTSVLVSPAPAEALAGMRRRVCIRFQGITWARGRPITTWVVVPQDLHGGAATGVIVIGAPIRPR